MISQEDNSGFLAVLARVIHWIIEGISTIAEPVIIAVTVVMIASDVSGGGLIAGGGLFATVYSWGQAIGIEGQMVALAVRARKAFAGGKVGLGLFLILLVMLLAGVTFVGVGVANFQATFGGSIISALAMLGITQQVWVWIRSGILTVVAVTGAFLLYVPRAKLTAAQVSDEIEQERLYAQLKDAKASTGAAGMAANIKRLRGLAKVVAGRVETVEQEESETQDGQEENAAPADAPDNITTLASRRKRPRKGKKGPVKRVSEQEAKARIMAILRDNPNATIAAIAEKADLSTSTVSKHRASLLAQLRKAI